MAPSTQGSTQGYQGSDTDFSSSALQPCSPLWVQYWSYEKKHLHTSLNPVNLLGPMELRFQRGIAVMDGWTTCTHPEGRLYFYRPAEANCREVLTNSLLFDIANLVRAEQALANISAQLQNFADTPDDTIVVLDIRDNADYYYCASWSSRRIFWPEETDVNLTSGGGATVYDVSHLESRNQALFWCHAQTFPKHGGARAPISELKKLLNFAYVDTMTSEVSIVYYDKDTLTNMRSVADNLGDDVLDEYNVWIVARLMQTFYKERFVNYHGQPEAILNWGDTVPGKANLQPRSTWFRLVSPWLFGWPSVYLQEVEEIWVNGNIRYTRGQEFVTELKGDWERSTTPATMLLTANVSLLAIQSIDTGHGNNTRSVAQIASYASTLLSLANYMTCQVLLRQHRKIVNSTADLYFLGQTGKEHRSETMAVVFSLPHGLFLWSMLVFLFAICWVFFWETNLVTRAILGTLLAFLFVLLCSVMFFWRPTTESGLGISYKRIGHIRFQIPPLLNIMGFTIPRWAARRGRNVPSNTPFQHG